LIAAMLSSLPISNQFSSSIPRRGENFQPYVKANPKLIHSATLSNILRPKMAIVGFGALRGGGDRLTDDQPVCLNRA